MGIREACTCREKQRHSYKWQYEEMRSHINQAVLRGGEVRALWGITLLHFAFPPCSFIFSHENPPFLSGGKVTAPESHSEPKANLMENNGIVQK
ncbi:hypothetical protein XELAEV_18029471mg [Xenopus laevis]|uniref:Uncharacterized protein n=1 Tax=Xenopus laevis TaxID=8355 RepID=A0A974HHK7_XENLA|nr:hypothetical protein XELAEV_18029471mg [Xenopus laevis]